MRRKLHLCIRLIVFIIIIASLIALGACSNTTFGELSGEGEGILIDVCRICHGTGGIGGFAPPLDERLGYSFENAKQLYDKIRFEMPRNKPGSLATMEYQQVLSYILIKNGFVGQQEIFKAGQLSDITIPDYTP